MITNTNYVELSGRLANNIIIYTAKTGRKYGVATLAINKYYKDLHNIKCKQSSFFNMFIWHPGLLELYKESLFKGAKVIVRGELVNYNNKLLISIRSKDGISILSAFYPLKAMEDEVEIEEINIVEAVLAQGEHV